MKSKILVIFICSTLKIAAQYKNTEFVSSTQIGFIASKFQNSNVYGLNINLNKLYKKFEFGIVLNTFSNSDIAPNGINFYMMDFGLKANRNIFNKNKFNIWGGVITGFTTSYLYNQEFNILNYVWPPSYQHLIARDEFNYSLSPNLYIEYLIYKKLSVYNNLQYKFLLKDPAFSDKSDFEKLSITLGLKFSL